MRARHEKQVSDISV